MMETQVVLETAHDDCNTKKDHLDHSSYASDWVGHKASPLLAGKKEHLPPFNPDSNSNATSYRLDHSLEPHCEEEESCLTASSKASTYCRQGDLATSGVYVPIGTNYNLHCEGKNLELFSSEHSKDPLRKEEEENFIILINSSEDENFLPPLGNPLRYQCKNCEQSFQNLSKLQEHKQLHVAGRSYWCPICGKEFFRAANLRMHKLTHSTDRPHKCPECDKGFIRTADVWRHLRSMHKIERSSIILESANIINPWSVLQQNRSENKNSKQLGPAVGYPGEGGSQQYLCPICFKGFNKPNLLSKHKVIHWQDKPYKCKECGKAFVQQVNLKRHHRTHTGERPFCCEGCGSTFARLSSLQRHQRIHTGEKPYSCACCGLAFTELGTLKRHERIHKVIQS